MKVKLSIFLGVLSFCNLSFGQINISYSQDQFPRTTAEFQNNKIMSRFFDVDHQIINSSLQSNLDHIAVRNTSTIQAAKRFSGISTSPNANTRAIRVPGKKDCYYTSYINRQGIPHNNGTDLGDWLEFYRGSLPQLDSYWQTHDFDCQLIYDGEQKVEFEVVFHFGNFGDDQKSLLTELARKLKLGLKLLVFSADKNGDFIRKGPHFEALSLDEAAWTAATAANVYPVKDIVVKFIAPIPIEYSYFDEFTSSQHPNGPFGFLGIEIRYNDPDVEFDVHETLDFLLPLKQG